jgi:sulfatase maturation enzyme AslB (radical SAM superfamily)
MDRGAVRNLFDYLSQHISGIKIMGGEPTVHPDFVSIYEYAQKKFGTVKLFTNARNDIMREITPRLSDAVTYNLLTIRPDFDVEKLLPSANFERTFETMVGANSNMKQLLDNVSFIYKLCCEADLEGKVFINVTLNCVEDIFEHKDVLNHNWMDLVQHIQSLDPSLLSFDHKIPYCFWKKETLGFMKDRGIESLTVFTCRPGDYGLINTNFDLLYCNQHPVKISSMFRKGTHGEFISFHRMNTLLFKAYMEKLLINLRHGDCLNCVHAITKCTGGCFKHKYAPVDLVKSVHKEG